MQRKTLAVMRETPGKVDVYYQAFNDWEHLYPTETIVNGHIESARTIEANKKKIDRLFLNNTLLINSGRLIIDTAQRVMQKDELLAQEMLIVIPHNDDICWAYNLFKGQHDVGANIQTMLFASDCSGISATYAARYAAEHFDEQTYSLEELKQALAHERIQEYEGIVSRLGGTTLHLPISVESCYEPTKVKRDEQRLYSYLSEYRDFDDEERKLIVDFFKSKMIHWATSHWPEVDRKLAVVTPFVYDNHPAHKMLFRLVLEAFLAVPEKYQQYIRFFMYPSLDVLQDKPGSVYYTFDEEGKRNKFYAWREMNTQLQRNEDFYLRRFPMIDTANAKQCKPPTEAPYAEKLIELKYQKTALT